jgi:hypothetical protein
MDLKKTKLVEGPRMMETSLEEYRLRLDGVDEGLMSGMITDLVAKLEQSAPTSTIKREREDQNAQDFGSGLLLVRLQGTSNAGSRQLETAGQVEEALTLLDVLASPAVVPVVKALIEWLKSTHRVKLHTPDGRVLADNITERSCAS